MPKNAFLQRTRDLLISPKTTQRHFLFTLHPLSTVIFATATVSVFVLLRNSNSISTVIRSVKLRLLRNRPGSALRQPASLNRPIKGIEQRHLFLLHQSVVLSVIDYGLGVTTMAQTNLLNLDRVQNEAMRVILETTKNTSIETTMFMLGLPPVQTR